MRQDLTAVLCALLVGGHALAQVQPKPYEPEIGQGGKDVVWVPTPPALVEKIRRRPQHHRRRPARRPRHRRRVQRRHGGALDQAGR
jgi:hypothetical protein